MADLIKGCMVVEVEVYSMFRLSAMGRSLCSCCCSPIIVMGFFFFTLNYDHVESVSSAHGLYKGLLNISYPHS